MRTLLITSITLMLLGCFEPSKLDASTDITITESLNSIKSDLSPADSEKIDKAVALYRSGGLGAFQEQAYKLAAAFGAEIPKDLEKPLSLSDLHGKTAKQIIDLYNAEATKVETFNEQIKAKQRKKEQAAAELQKQRDLEQKKKEERIASYIPKIELYNFRTGREDIYVQDNAPIVYFSLRNNGDESLKRVEATIKYKDKAGTLIQEETCFTSFSGSKLYSDPKPLKPSFIYESIRCALSMELKPWDQSKTEVTITNIAFAD